jgi:hypothetical protein
MMNSESIYILHLSDLHFGPHSRFSRWETKELGHRLSHAVAAELRKRREAKEVSLVLVTGDIAEAALPKEYHLARGFFEGLAGGLGLARQRFVFTPGNHDVCWPRSQQAELDQAIEGFDEQELRRRMDAYKFEFYDSFVKEFYGADSTDSKVGDSRGAAIYNFEDLAISIATLNSCEVESHRPADHRGELSSQQVQVVMNYWRGCDNGKWIKIVCVHHNPVVTVVANVEGWKEYLKSKRELSAELIDRFATDVAGLGGREHLRRLAEECEVQLVLHGHHHATDQQSWPWKAARTGQTQILSAGSWGLGADKLPGEEPNTIQLLRLRVGQRKVQPIILKYEPRALVDGQVEPGQFVRDLAFHDNYNLTLSLPSQFQASNGMPARKHKQKGDVSEFIREYRLSLSALYSRWDLSPVGVTQAGGADKPIVADLDEMYIPLRFAEELANETPDGGSTLLPDELLRRGRPMVISGHAGSGKTTSMRWMFRQLLGNEVALPVMVELRRLARVWQQFDGQGRARSLENYLENWIENYVGSGWKGWLSEVVKRQAGPRPVLLVDGWDELGDVGEELRSKLLGYIKNHPRVQVIVSSRPYSSDSRPSHAEGFDVLHLQPLSDDEIEAFSCQFFTKCYAEDEATMKEQDGLFMAALRRSPEAEALARTPLLLTMMLLISRSRPLPDKRHQLYQACIENLLTALPDRKQREGALILREQFRPDDSEERMREVAKMASQMQEVGYESGERAAVVRTWEEMASFLPPEWKSPNRIGFVAWLTGPAGLLVERADGSVSFAHLSFQEYLTAWHLHATVEGDDNRIALCQRMVLYETWWETLRLWAALVEGRNPRQLEPVLNVLMKEDEKGVWFTGTILADGLGSAEMMAEWASRVVELLLGGWPSGADYCAQAWAASRQDVRRMAIAELFQSRVPDCNWLQWIRLKSWVQKANLTAELSPPSEGSNARFLVESLEGRADTGRHIALGRILSHGSPLWPGLPPELLLLQTWPSDRRVVGANLQVLASFPISHAELLEKSKKFFLRQTSQPDRLSNALKAMRDVMPGRSSDATVPLPPDAYVDILGDLILGMNYMYGMDTLPKDTRHWFLNVMEYLAFALETNSADESLRERALDLANYWTKYVAEVNRGSSRFRGTIIDLYKVSDVGRGSIPSLGFLSPRALIAQLAPSSTLLTLFSTACRLSLHPHSSPEPFAEALRAYPKDGDPLWPALARHLVRRATPTDEELLNALSRRPEERDSYLSWGLRYIVRGDVVADNGDDITLDQITDELGIPHLPHLENI